MYVVVAVSPRLDMNTVILCLFTVYYWVAFDLFRYILIYLLTVGQQQKHLKSQYIVPESRYYILPHMQSFHSSTVVFNDVDKMTT